MTKATSFEAALELMDSPLKWVIVRVPKRITKPWGKGRIPVAGEINGFAFRTSLFPSRAGEHLMIVNKRMQAAAKVRAGHRAEFRLEFDTEDRTVTIPHELNRLLKQDKQLRIWFDKLNYSTRNEIAKWISAVKSAEARVRRAEQITERMLATMDAERELPPILQRAFAANPRARQGWERMPASHRRSHLMGIFGYRSPESRARRVAKMMEEAARYGEKKRRSE